MILSLGLYNSLNLVIARRPGLLISYSTLKFLVVFGNVFS